jgi:hypothetical protein
VSPRGGKVSIDALPFPFVYNQYCQANRDQAYGQYREHRLLPIGRRSIETRTRVNV